MRVTIVCDASVDHLCSTGTYAFWAVSERRKYAGSGVFKGGCCNSNEAEAMAVVNALHAALNLGIALAGDEVLIQTDSLHAINTFTSKLRPVIARKYQRFAQAFRELVARHALVVTFRHVKGHSRVTDARSRSQRLTDRHARKTMRAARKAKAAA